jgi:CRISPR-associated protein Csd2
MSINRHDILIFFDVKNGNPNGNPDAGNMPRIEPNTGKGLVSDVCLKRKVRNFVSQFPSPTRENGNEFGIIVQQGTVINPVIRDAEEKYSGELKKLPKSTKPAQKKAAEDKAAKESVAWLCRKFYDIRTFGMVLGTGAKEDLLTGSAHGQVRGPVQFTFAMSVNPIPTQEITVTRCAVTKVEDTAKERTMGNKHIVPYGLYCAKAFVSPMFAERTGFDDADLQLFFDAIAHMFRDDPSAARAEMNVHLIYDFEHVGTQSENNAAQKRREQQLGCKHAHKLFEEVSFTWEKGEATNGRTFPAEFGEYTLIDKWRNREADLLKQGVKLNRLVDPTPLPDIAKPAASGEQSS